jgi:WD40 repeat-containing protein SMU1
MTEIEAKDVVKIVLQFLKESELTSTFESLQKESGVTLNTVDDADEFVGRIKEGKWDQVLLEVASLDLPVAKVQALHELIVLELIELREVETARSLLRQSEPLSLLRSENEDKYIELEKACNRTVVDVKQLYGGMSRQKRRNMVAKMMKGEVRSVPPSRLMVLIGQAIKWQRQEGLIPSSAALDVFSGVIPTTADDEDAFPSNKDIAISFGSKSYPECVAFLPDGSGFVTGSYDGFVEVWDVLTGALKQDLAYQKNEKFMMHETAVLCVTVSSDGVLLATGDKTGTIKVWKMSSGKVCNVAIVIGRMCYSQRKLHDIYACRPSACSASSRSRRRIQTGSHLCRFLKSATRFCLRLSTVQCGFTVLRVARCSKSSGVTRALYTRLGFPKMGTLC